MRAWLSVACLLAIALAAPLSIDRTTLGKRFDGIGGLSGGGATSRLLVDYPAAQQSEILDLLFKPNFGASLHTLKVEIGGDSQSTDGTESSHMHTADDQDYHRGYEWWLMVEAKKRNPDIKLYGLAWAFPGWVGNGTGSPFTYPNLTATYITNWVNGAKTVYGLDIDYVGIWNERSSSATYVQLLKKHLADAGYANTLVVAKDGDDSICESMAQDPAYAAAVDIIGLHYPSDYANYSVCHSLNKPFWASEESSSYDDLNGAACWARVITSHWVLSQIQASIMWNLVGSYYHGTNWYASSMMTAVEPWTGSYVISPVLYATAHVTQFTQPGWFYLPNGSGSGQLPQGGFYATFVDTTTKDFTLMVVKISWDHAPCTRPSLPDFTVSSENVTFQLAASMGGVTSLALWHSNLEEVEKDAALFEQRPDIAVVNGQFSLHVKVGDVFTVSTIRTATKGTYSPPASQPRFPLPYSDDFQGYPQSQEARYFSDQIGAFEIHPETNTSTNLVMRQMVPALPIGWSDPGTNGPQTLIGMIEWQDVSVSVSFMLPPASPKAAACVATRIDQMWFYGVALCMGADQTWNLTLGGPRLGGQAQHTYVGGKVSRSIGTAWHVLSLTTVGTAANGSIDGEVLFTNAAIRDIDTGFSGMGANDWYQVQYDNFSVAEAGSAWAPTRHCGSAKDGDVLSVNNCTRNGLTTPDQTFDLLSNWLLRHRTSGLCVATASVMPNARVTLKHCDEKDKMQQFKNDYTNIRNDPQQLYLDAFPHVILSGDLSGAVYTTSTKPSSTGWNQWVYYPNTGQLRNQYTANTALGYPRCLSTCPKSQ